MKRKYRFRQAVLLLVVTFLASCATEGDGVVPLPDGYSVVAHKKGIIDPAVWGELQYVGPDKKRVTVWPYVTSSNTGIIIKNGVAVFLGQKSIENKNQKGEFSFRRRIFVARAPAPAVDVSEAVLKKWSIQSHYNYEETLANYDYVSLLALADSIEVEMIVLKNGEPAGTKYQIAWNQILDFMKSD
jgi:hypothetical protein